MGVPKNLAEKGSKEAAIEFLSAKLRKIYRTDVLPKEATDAVEAIVADIEFPTVTPVATEKPVANAFKRSKNNPVPVETEQAQTADVQPETDTQNNL